MFDKFLGGKTYLSPLKDPFKKGKITGINIHYSTWSSRGYWWARIEFENGKTKGEQRFGDYAPDEYEKLMLEIKAFVESLE